MLLYIQNIPKSEYENKRNCPISHRALNHALLSCQWSSFPCHNSSADCSRSHYYPVYHPYLQAYTESHPRLSSRLLALPRTSEAACCISAASQPYCLCFQHQVPLRAHAVCSPGGRVCSVLPLQSTFPRRSAGRSEGLGAHLASRPRGRLPALESGRVSRHSRHCCWDDDGGTTTVRICVEQQRGGVRDGYAVLRVCMHDLPLGVGCGRWMYEHGGSGRRKKLR